VRDRTCLRRDRDRQAQTGGKEGPGEILSKCLYKDEDVIKKILKHLGLWDIKRKPSPVANAPPIIPDSYPIPSVDDKGILINSRNAVNRLCAGRGNRWQEKMLLGLLQKD